MYICVTKRKTMQSVTKTTSEDKVIYGIEKIMTLNQIFEKITLLSSVECQISFAVGAGVINATLQKWQLQELIRDNGGDYTVIVIEYIKCIKILKEQ